MARKKKISEVKVPKKRKERRPPPYICPIYRRDIAGFLTREEVDEWRLMSRLSNYALSEFPSMLPRRVYPGLSIHVYNGPCRRRVNGYVSRLDEIPGKAFDRIFKFQVCCRELKEVSESLVGQRIFPNKPDDEVIAFVLCTEVFPIREVALRVVNRLTAPTANGLVHFLRHIKGCRFDDIHLNFQAPLMSEEHGRINPELMKVLSRVHSRKKFMLYTDTTRCMESLSLKVARQLVHYHRFYTYLWDPEEMVRLLNFLSSNRALVNEATTRMNVWMFGIDFVDTLVRYFTEIVHALNEAVPSVTFSCFLAGWPQTCPKRRAYSIDRHLYTYRCKNVHSGEEFELTLTSIYTDRRLRAAEMVREIRLKFR